MKKVKLGGMNSVVFFTGAGMSKESGVPVYRGQGGIWNEYPWEEVACEDAFQRDAKRVLDFHEKRRGLVMDCQPHAGHYHLAELEKAGAPITIVTQNIDGMHQRAGSKHVLELHGSLFRVRCGCPKTTETPGVAFPYRTCPTCGEAVRPDITWFGDSLDMTVFEEATQAISGCDLFVSIGTSGVVWPAAGLPEVAEKSGAIMIEINPEEGPQSHLFHRHIRMPASQSVLEAFSL